MKSTPRQALLQFKTMPLSPSSKLTVASGKGELFIPKGHFLQQCAKMKDDRKTGDKNEDMKRNKGWRVKRETIISFFFLFLYRFNFLQCRLNEGKAKRWRKRHYKQLHKRSDSDSWCVTNYFYCGSVIFCSSTPPYSVAYITSCSPIGQPSNKLRTSIYHRPKSKIILTNQKL
jgi:hypothetical protein